MRQHWHYRYGMDDAERRDADVHRVRTSVEYCIRVSWGRRAASAARGRIRNSLSLARIPQEAARVERCFGTMALIVVVLLPQIRGGGTRSNS